MTKYLIIIKCWICTILIVSSSSTNALPVPKYLRTTTNGLSEDSQHQSRVVNLDSPSIVEPSTASAPGAGAETSEKKDTILFQATPAKHTGGYIRRFQPTTTTTTESSSIVDPNLAQMIPTLVTAVNTKNSENMKMTVRNIEYPDIVLDAEKTNNNEENKNFIIPNQRNSLINTWLKDLYNFSKKEDDVDIGFQSLFRLPDIKGNQSGDSKNCPKNFRRGHHGKCVRPIKIKITIVEEEIDDS